MVDNAATELSDVNFYLREQMSPHFKGFSGKAQDL